MPTLTDTQTKSDTARSEASSKQGTSGSPSSDETLGYEVLYRRRVNGIQVPLALSQSLSNLESPKRSTGSALLDSLITERTGGESAPLRNLRLVNVAKQIPHNIPSLPDRPPAVKPPTAKTPVPSAPVLTDPPSAKVADAASVTDIAPVADAVPVADIAPVADAAPIVETTPEDEAIAARPMPSATIQLPELPPTVANKEAPEAETDSSELDKQTPQTPEQQVPSPQPAEPVAPPARPPSPIRTIPTPTVQRPPAFSHTAVDDKKARDSAASVGLLDLDDTLLFGGDHQDLANSDPFVETAGSSATGVLTYIIQQISAFTVSEIKSGFPHTDPNIINRIDPPKRHSVLDLQNFKLGDLTTLDEEPPAAKQTRPPIQAANDEISTLSQQVEMLNRKIADLSQKLAQVTDSQANG